MSGKKIAVLFPGIGYTCKRPLLYYTGMLAQEYGYGLIRLDYGEDIHSMKCRDAQALAQVAELALARVCRELTERDLRSCDRLLFLSKSVGTVVACRLEQKLGISALHYLMTPIPATLPYLDHCRGLFVSGTGDPYISEEEVLEAAQRYPGKVGRIFEGCNHSLERPGHTAENLQNLQEVVALLAKMLENQT